MEVQDVINASSTDFRNVLSSSAPDSALFISWVDRIQKDALHTGMYNYLIQQTGTISVVAGTNDYVIPVTAGNVRRVQMVYDRTFDRVIMPIESTTYPTAQEEGSSPRQPLQLPLEMLNAETMSQYPKYYKVEYPANAATLYLFPSPQKTAFNGTYEVHYEMQVPDLTTTASTLLVPDDGMDQIVAGVNAYVAQFLHLDQESTYWAQEYQMLKKGTANT